MYHMLSSIARSAGLNWRHAEAAKQWAAAARMCVERYTIAMAGNTRARASGRILCYHAVGQPELGVNNVSLSRFRAQIDLALASGYTFVPARDIASGRSGPRTLAITFDDAWQSVLTTAAPVLHEAGIPWSLFVVSGWSSHRQEWAREKILSWKDLEAAIKLGAEIGSHSVTHPDFGKIADPVAVDELEQSRSEIERQLGIRIDSFAIPFGQSRNWSARLSERARAAGYSLLYAQAEATRSPGTIPRTFVTRFDREFLFNSALQGKFDDWEEWVWT